MTNTLGQLGDDSGSLPVRGTRRTYDPLTGRPLATSPARQPAPFRSKEIVVTLETPNRRVKVFRIDWLKRDVGLSVGLPYFSPAHAVLGRYELRVPPGGQESVSLLEGGKVTRQPVKLSFHKSGTVLFSSTGRINSVIRNQSFPLVGRPLHLFSIYVRGPGGFAPTDHKDGHPPAAYRAVWNLESAEHGDAGFKIVGRWYPLARLKLVRSEPGFEDRPNLVRIETREGGSVSGFMFSQIPTWPWGGYGLLLSQEPWSIDDGHPRPYVLVQGGFGRLSSPGKLEAGDTFLAGMYTDRSAEIDDLTRSLGSVDLLDV